MILNITWCASIYKDATIVQKVAWGWK